MRPPWLTCLPLPLTDRFEAQIGWRYTRAGAARGNGFLSFISTVSMLGIALGVAALIIVLSVMNGFQKEVRERMLHAVAHAEVLAPAGQPLSDWQALAREAGRDARVLGAAPFVAQQALASHEARMRGAVVRGIDPALEPQVTPLAARQPDLLQRLVPGQWQVLLGVELAHALGVRIGDPVMLMAPGGQVTPAGVVPRMRAFTVAGVFEAGHFEHDSTLALVHLQDAARLFRSEGPTGLQLRLADVHQAPEVARALQDRLAPAQAGLQVRDWTQTHRQWFDAVQVEKRMMSLILTLIVAVAAFNLVSTLVMTVTDKQADIAILRTLGASPRSVMGIFVVQGATAGVLGTLAGTALGLGVALHIDTLVPMLERALGTAFLPGHIYLISRMPSEPLASDIVPVVVTALLLALLATLYPSWRASRINPAQALRHG